MGLINEGAASFLDARGIKDVAASGSEESMLREGQDNREDSSGRDAAGKCVLNGRNAQNGVVGQPASEAVKEVPPSGEVCTTERRVNRLNGVYVEPVVL